MTSPYTTVGAAGREIRMKYKTLFRMLLKLLGVFFSVGGIQGIITHLAQLMGMLSLPAMPSGQTWFYLLAISSPVIELAMGVYLFFGGGWIIDRAIPSNRPYCHECGYDLTNAAGHVCTECGTPFKPVEMSSVP